MMVDSAIREVAAQPAWGPFLSQQLTLAAARKLRQEASKKVFFRLPASWHSALDRVEQGYASDHTET